MAVAIDKNKIVTLIIHTSVNSNELVSTLQKFFSNLISFN